MSTPNDCCQPCPVTQTVNIPGAPGATGAAGADGANAFTTSTADFVVPALSGSVTVSGVNWAWAELGQNIFIQGAGTFVITAIAGNKLSATLTYLNYASNTAAGNTISTGAGISPGGFQPIDTLLPAVTGYALAGAQVLTVTPAQVLSLSLALPTTGSYLLLATCRVDLVAATVVAPTTLALKLRETTLGPADIANAIVHAKVGIEAAMSFSMFNGGLPPVVYAATGGATVELFASLDGLPYTGNIEAIEASIVAIKLF